MMIREPAPKQRGLLSRPKALALFFCLSALIVGDVYAQQQELTSRDRQQVLYAPQLNFTTEGDPMIRVGILEDRDEVVFTPSEPIRVLPQGEGGPEIHLPGDTKYRVTIEDGRAGEYRHWVVVDGLSASQRESLDEVEEEWTRRGYLPRRFEVGGLFAIRGKLFDSRLWLVTVGGMEDAREARALKRELEAKYGIVGRVHSELTTLPSGRIVLRGDGIEAKVEHEGVLWVMARQGRAEAIRYEVPGVDRSYGRGRQTREYLGTLVFAPSRTGQLVAMNTLGAERLLRGVVPSEIYASAPEEALKAQAVAARNEVFGAIGVRNLADPFMQRADIYDQVYKGVSVEDPRTTRAVQETRGEVMFYGDQIVKAVYSANAGGFTESNEHVWEAEPLPYLRGRPDAPEGLAPPYMRDGLGEGELRRFLEDDYGAHSKDAPVGSRKYYRWEASAGVEVARAWLRKGGRDVGRIQDLEVVERGMSGRAKRLEVTGERGRVVVERELNIRRLFGGLKSGLFVMTVDREEGYVRGVSFEGAGFGHGVGMCQTGATGMAARGKSYREILEHYYTGVDVRSLY